MKQLIKEGKIPISRIDDAVRRILKVKFELGLFENRYVDPTKDVYATKINREIALTAARECIILLKNSENLLPINEAKYKRILVTGPNANNQAMLGDWSFFQPDSNVVTALEGMQMIASNSEIIYSNSGRIRSELSHEKTNTTDPALQKKILSEGGGISDLSLIHI